MKNQPPKTEGAYRFLNSDEINKMLQQGCSSTDWNLVEVSHDFVPDNIHNTKFTGHIKLNTFNRSVRLLGGIEFNSGIYNAWLHNCEVGKDVLIHNIRGYIANYKIEERVIIHNVTTLAVDGDSSFGNGVKVETINEIGGRIVPIYDHLSTHIAYIIALYRHRAGLISSLTNMIEGYTKSVTNRIGVIGARSKILNCNTILNVKIGPRSIIDGAQKLKNGSINSNFDDRIIVGEGVIMEDFIVCSGSKITDSTLISKSFIGQGCIMDKHYSAVNSLFFANCQGLHGEACAIFAGPYTVTHHKSTLLIAGMFSFLNAGSGSNQSNHLYKLGPIHQGILERGAKTTSNSYILWPSRVGAFTLVMGRHYKHSDTTDFPFSYMIENRDESYLVPGANLKSIGTIRDTQKWPKRDNRKGSDLLDHINFNLLSPYSIQKMINGREKLLALKKASGEYASEYSLDNLKISKNALNRGIMLYEMATWKFLGNSLITRLSKKEFSSVEEVITLLKCDTPLGRGNWVDLSGLICPFNALDTILSSIETGNISSLEEINSALATLHHNYYNYEWSWAKETIENLLQKNVENFTADDIIGIIEKWRECVTGIDKFLYEDARKEFSLAKKTGFGVDGEEDARELDFKCVRGDFEQNETVMAINSHIEKKNRLGDDMIQKIRAII